MMNSSKTEIDQNKKIKSFQYLDTDKMYSISSQIFAGLPEYVINSEENNQTKSTNQKGREWGSGQTLANIIQESSGKVEKRFLHDYSYVLFEDALLNASKVLELNEDNVLFEIDNLSKFSFIKVTGRVLINDQDQVQNSIKQFNQVMDSLNYVQHSKDIDTLTADLATQKEALKKHPDRNKKAVLQARLDDLTNQLDILIKQNGSSLSPEFIKNMSFLLDYGYSGQFELQMPMLESDFLFSCTLNRKMLKESEDLLVKKYSRETEKKFTIFGIPSQTLGKGGKLDSHIPLPDDIDATMKHALRNVLSQLTKMENTFIGSLENEIVIDPIAVYLEI